MIRMTLGEIAAVTGGRLVNADEDAAVTGPVEFDSRRVEPGGLFVAFDGEKVDGHAFAAGAVRAGAAAVLGDRDTGEPGLVVGDQLAALAALARAVLDRLPELTVVGLTGSSGKTTTKDYIGQLLSRLGPTIAPPGSLNNELGHPYTVLKATPQTRFLVLEMGARGIGHIRHLAQIAPPRIGLVLNVGAAHLGEFGSVEGTARAKGELVEAVPADGAAILNADDPLVAGMAGRASGRVVTFGESAAAQVRAEEVTLDDRGRAAYLLRGHPVRLGVTGRHQVSNTLAAAAVALEAGMPAAQVAAALTELSVVSSRRMDVFDRPDGVTVIDDSYNANPSSTAAALRALAAMAGDRRTVAVLGYMAELGEYEKSGHEEVGRLAAELGVERLVAVADNAAPILDGARAVVGWTGTAIFAADQAAAIAAIAVEPGDIVLVKGSRYRTWEVADALRPSAPGETTVSGAQGGRR
ncbi:UDP-N-acetylmuramoyl-tripeptide--D-alanyl-D-alanine ligase [Mangrovihabitans endophyticus]|uniref:UDP-N-acetylmuramoyl-tripeptide--D-alanyl-D-alanine ligase n=1 Tax=Mangrovihabitans endophyticus TaxID=1751298 RepID=A0A8J3BW06_9ACTN|nr:UDP-N-acetylmuramoyl-tripeptide--D-alanyl-D-alanine ligase [Mangrovihabitans endophyticus]GGK70536.1 UDP-N-acetylmuramoyl-tripeptide--D-alanyl-D-alanine ligase [Mangrovihabitans endophyticus]